MNIDCENIIETLVMHQYGYISLNNFRIGRTTKYLVPLSEIGPIHAECIYIYSWKTYSF